jgi:large subunit ribosomal protein L29
MAKLELKELTVEQLNTEVANAELRLQQLRYDNATGVLANTAEIAHSKKNIARIKTELRAREIEELTNKGTLKRDKIRVRRSLQKKLK